MRPRPAPARQRSGGRRAAALRALALAAAGGIVVACDPAPEEAEPEQLTMVDGPLRRTGRFGSLRDLVYVPHASERSAGLFVDRFEVTQADWARFARTEAGVAADAGKVSLLGRGTLPVAGIDLFQARAFAEWRMGRLPSEAEWRQVTRGGARNPFPWGGNKDATRANTADLAFGEAVPVGTFESGRKAGGDMPYDLIGNVREWTETVPGSWCHEDGLSVEPSFGSCHDLLTGMRAMRDWSVMFGLLPSGCVAAAGQGDVPRKVVGADFATPMSAVVDGSSDEQLAGERRQRTGLRVYASPASLLDRLLDLPEPPTAGERLQLLRFIMRDDHRAVLREALQSLPISGRPLPAGSIAELVLQELRRSR